MKRFVFLLTTIFMCTIAYAHTINWHVGNTILQTTTCDSGESITPPTPPYKYGYHFKEWLPYSARIEYLESTGTQYIDTGAKFSNANVSIKLLIDFIAFSTQGYMGHNGCTQLRMSYLKENVRQIAYSLCRSNGITINVVDDVQKESNSYGFSGGRLFLYALHGWSGDRCVGRMYYAKIYIDDILVRDFIPVLDPSGVPCMFDKVTKQFFYNQGTGQFIAGPVIEE